MMFVPSDELADDLASFHNVSPEVAHAALVSAVQGDPVPMRRFGVEVDPANVVASILEQTKDVQGDVARVAARAS